MTARRTLRRHDRLEHRCAPTGSARSPIARAALVGLALVASGAPAAARLDGGARPRRGVLPFTIALRGVVCESEDAASTIEFADEAAELPARECLRPVAGARIRVGDETIDLAGAISDERGSFRLPPVDVSSIGVELEVIASGLGQRAASLYVVALGRPARSRTAYARVTFDPARNVCDLRARPETAGAARSRVGARCPRDAFDLKRRIDERIARAFPELVDVQGRRFDRGDLDGSLTLFEFWATWCRPCRYNLPYVSEVAATLGPCGVRVIGVNWDTSDDEAFGAWLSAHGIGWPQVREPDRDRNGTLSALFEVDAIPASVLIGPDGTVLATDLFGPSNREFLEELLRDPSLAARLRTPDRAAGCPAPGR